jgi:hypothetical protein
MGQINHESAMTVVERLRNALGFGERRQHPRISRPAMTVKVNGRSYLALDWSLGGCRLKAGVGEFQVKQRVTGSVRLEAFDDTGVFAAEVVRLNPDGDVGLRWVEISPVLFQAMRPVSG